MVRPRPANCTVEDLLRIRRAFRPPRAALVDGEPGVDGRDLLEAVGGFLSLGGFFFDLLQSPVNHGAALSLLVTLSADEREDVGLTTSRTRYFDLWQPLHSRVWRLDENPHCVLKATVATGVLL
jgi:hypothetical protein